LKCAECGELFEELMLSANDSATCRECNAENVKRLLSKFAASVKSSGGSAAPSCPSKSGSGFG